MWCSKFINFSTESLILFSFSIINWLFTTNDGFHHCLSISSHYHHDNFSYFVTSQRLWSHLFPGCDVTRKRSLASLFLNIKNSLAFWHHDFPRKSIETWNTWTTKTKNLQKWLMMLTFSSLMNLQISLMYSSFLVDK